MVVFQWAGALMLCQEMMALAPEGVVTGIRYNGVDNLIEVRNNESNRGYCDLFWITPGSKAAFDLIRGTSLRVIVENKEQVEPSFLRTWESSLEGEFVPLNVDKRWVTSTGVHVTTKITRILFKNSGVMKQGKKFPGPSSFVNSMSVGDDDLRWLWEDANIKVHFWKLYCSSWCLCGLSLAWRSPDHGKESARQSYRQCCSKLRIFTAEKL
ncbi:hypothetical protein MLD38_034520 [Melastoma candidum]|uniref:Uncharacterized protein n=1 Tax=Melastoma candidum TaxID=119954 RepID=A0ACB9MAA9_9MYRT|nr:hypothetical protein MLD38_034520 [Melastoma candidum]